MSALGLKRPLVTILLIDGPCAGRHERVAALSVECWARVGKPEGRGVESRMWARYDRVTKGRYAYSGITITDQQLEDGLRAAKAAGHTFGKSEGA